MYFIANIFSNIHGFINLIYYVGLQGCLKGYDISHLFDDSTAAVKTPAHGCVGALVPRRSNFKHSLFAAYCLF